MSDWLEDELSRHLTPVRAPEELRVRLGFARPKRREFPRMAMAVAATVVVMMAGGLAASRTASVDPRSAPSIEARNVEPVEFTSSDKGAISVWLGHARGEVKEHAPVLVARASTPARKNAMQSTDAGCVICHTL